MDTLKNKIEMTLLGYTVYGDKEGYDKTFYRLADKFLFSTIREKFNFGKCYVCEKWGKVELVPVDAEPSEDGVMMIKEYVCEDCYED
jgi:hypothetical protein